MLGTASVSDGRTSGWRRLAQSNTVVALGAVVWLAALGVGFAALLAYKNTPGADDVDGHPGRWPAGTTVPRDPSRHTLVMFAHPRCPCTEASVTELGRVMSELSGHVSAVVVVVALEGVDEGWDSVSLAGRAGRIPGVTVVRDPDGREATRFGALTSGLVMLYDAGGTLQFSGGITASRGHEGDSFGERRVVSLVKTGTADRRDSPVFGCGLLHANTSTAVR
jgi:hypothetical protein